MVRSVNSMPVFSALKSKQAVTPRNVTMFKGESVKPEKPIKTKDPNSVGYWRAAFSRLTDEQIKNANETGKLSGKVKIKQNSAGTGYTIAPNLMNITTGTQTIPAGYELRKNWLGFTTVLPKDSEGLFVKKKV